MGEVLGVFKGNGALVISICALLLTSYQAWATRRHNRLTVKPALTSFTHTDTDQNDKSITVVTATLSNHGLGPAFIKKFEILIDGNPVEVDDPGQMYSVVSQAVTPQLIRERCRFVLLRKDYVMKKDAELELGVVATRITSPAQAEELQKFHVRVVYESAYGQSFTYDSRDHK